MTNRFSLILCCLIFCIACKNEQESASNTLPVPTESTSVATKKSEAKGELVQEKSLSVYATNFYTNLLWHYDAAVVINDPEKRKLYEGKWIKFNPDNTLETGFYNKKSNTGSWKLDESKNILTILENTVHPTYSEWKVKTSSSSEAIMVWVGTKQFGLNNTQIKLQRSSKKPVKTE